MVLKVLEFVLGGFYGFKVCVCRFFLPQARRSGRLSATSQRSSSRTGGARSQPEEKKRMQTVDEEAPAVPASKKKKLTNKK